ncbi:hypothetical protein JL722_10679 [Aureococcus anophagefferens]|nr:hypothetical protein JL722_10679 [Aureococcus anophagefferens]
MAQYHGLLLLLLQLASSDDCARVALGRNFSQADAPRDMALVRSILLQRLQEEFPRTLDSVKWSYSGADLDARSVGTREIDVDVARRDGGELVESCLRVVYDVADTDECATHDAAWRHRCDASAACANTVGGDDQRYDRVPWRRLRRARRAPRGLCWGHADTKECCAGDDCRGAFKCASDPAAGGRACARRTELRAGRAAERPLVADGRVARLAAGRLPVRLRGRRPRGRPGPLLAARRLRRRRVPALPLRRRRAGATCAPEPGYAKVDDGAGGELCVDAAAPRLGLLGDAVVRLRQGDSYVEAGVAGVDDRGGDSRRISTSVAFPDGPLGACLPRVGTFVVAYAVDAPWLDGSRWAMNRTVVVDDVNECVYAGPCARFRHACAPTAVCRNTRGAYACDCADGAAGDGKLGGTGCADARPPVLSCAGAGCAPRRFRAANVRGLASVDGAYASIADTGGLTFAADEILALHARGAADGSDPFCETANPCFAAHDLVPVDGRSRRRHDLSHRVRIGAIERRPELETSERAHFRVEYVVADADGNEARATRDVVVESISDAVRAQLLSGDVVFACSRRALLAAVAAGALVAAALLLGGASPLCLAAFACSPVLPPDVALALIGGRPAFLRAADAWYLLSRCGRLDRHDRLARGLRDFIALTNAAS